MTTGSPSARRVIEILNFFADHPGQSFTLTDLVRSLHLSRATAHAFLTTLADADYLYRASDKSYVLGPALSAIGRAAGDNLSPFQVAQPEMRRLADRFDAVCTAVTRDRYQVVLRERATSLSHLGLLHPPSSRLPLRPLFAGVFFAWEGAAQANAWFDKLQPPGSEEMRGRMHQGMAFAREHGFLVSIRVGQEARSQSDAEGDIPGASTHGSTAVITTIDADRTYLLSSINAPVFDRNGKIAFVMSLASLTRPCPGHEIMDMGRQLRETSDRITAFLGGRIPAC